MEIPQSNFTTTFAECPDCGGRRYLTGEAFNRHGEHSFVFDCGNCGEDVALWSIDIQVEWHEDWTTASDGGRWALAIRAYDDLPDEYVLRRLRVRDLSRITTWQELVAVYGEESVRAAMAGAGYES
jgi:hypothetical protein